MSTPIRNQYLHLKAQFPGAIMFFRLGDFYEMFDDDALTGSRELELTLTSREFARGERSPMCGVPYHAAEHHIARLVARGYKVAICEQIGDPRTAKGLVEREVVRVVTPGTTVEPALLDPRRNRYLAAAMIKGDEAGVAYADVTTGEISTMALRGRPVEPLVERELVRVAPSEILWPQTDGSDEPPVAVPDAFVTPFAPRYFTVAVATRCITEHYALRALDGQPYAGLPLAVGVAGALLAYLAQTQRALLPQLRPITLHAPENHMVLDGPTRRNLEIDQTMRGGTTEGSLLWVLDHTKTAMGARLLRRWVGSPLLQLGLVRERQDAVAALVENTALRQKLVAGLAHLPDLERLTGKVLQGTASPRDLVSLRTALERAEALRDVIGGPAGAPGAGSTSGMALQDLVAGLDSCADVREEIGRAIVDEPPAVIGEGRFIRPGYVEELDSIEESVKDARQWVASLERLEKERTGIRSLRVSYNKVFGYYIEVSNANRDLVPGDYIRKQTLVGAERYITPELKEREALILSADERRIALETSLLAQLRETIAAQAPRLLRTAESLAGLDVYAGLATIAVERDYVRPELDEGTRIEIVGGRHPVVEVTQRETPFVPNDATLDAAREQIIILTGPNMSGKSCYLRQTALITLLAQIGSFVPAERARVGLVDRIFTRVGAQDDIATGHSTFMVEMVETATILSSCTPRSLLILDEVGRGTSTYDGVAIAQALVEHLHDTPRRAAKTIFATHYHELNSLVERLSQVRNYRMDVLEEGDEVVFLRKVVPGGADKSYGIYVAELAGLPREVVRRARQILRELERKAAADRAALDSLQLSFFASPLDDAPAPVVSQPNGSGGPDGAISALLTELAGLDVDNMTPLQALAALARLRERARMGDGDAHNA
ncbi:MAG TPA: DNA mismatch repair protein MutS [Chloroflexota bacterium]|nr:DNA mismatch repair protein MutS [Chloroflexota bacterium]